MSEPTIPLMTDPTAEVVQQVKNELLPEIRSAIRDEFALMREQFVTRTEFAEIKEKRDTEIFTLRTELAHQRGQIDALRDQVQKTTDGQRELRESVQSVSASAAEIKAQHENIAAEVRSAIATFQQGTDLMMVTQQQMRVTIATQTEDRRRHDELAQRVTETADELADRIRHNAAVIDDTEKRYIESFVPLRDFVLGSETQPGLKKTLETITSAITNLRADLEPTRVWAQQRRNLEHTALRLATSRAGLIIIGTILAWLLNHLRLAALRGDITAALPSLINFLFGG